MNFLEEIYRIIVIEITHWRSLFQPFADDRHNSYLSWRWEPAQKVFDKSDRKPIVRWRTLLRPGLITSINPR